jgi:hypothetical protein
MDIDVRSAYDKGWRSQQTGSDWDDAADRFDRRYGRTHELRVAWMDGWSDSQCGHKKWHAITCPKGLTLGTNGNHDGHEGCEE